MIRSLFFILPVPQSLPGSFQTCLPVLCQHWLLSFSSGLRPTLEVLVVMIRGPLGEAGPFWELLCVSWLCSGEVTPRGGDPVGRWPSGEVTPRGGDPAGSWPSGAEEPSVPASWPHFYPPRSDPGALIKALHFSTQRLPGTASDFIFLHSFSALICLSIVSGSSKRLPLLHWFLPRRYFHSAIGFEDIFFFLFFPSTTSVSCFSLGKTQLKTCQTKPLETPLHRLLRFLYFPCL